MRQRRSALGCCAREEKKIGGHILSEDAIPMDDGETHNNHGKW